jgi:hypothetical protein
MPVYATQLVQSVAQLVQTLLPGLYWPVGQADRATHDPLTRAWVLSMQPQLPTVGVFTLKEEEQAVQAPVTSEHEVQFAAHDAHVPPYVKY